MEKDDIKTIISRVLLVFIALCVVFSFVMPNSFPFCAAGAALAAISVFIIELSR